MEPAANYGTVPMDDLRPGDVILTESQVPCGGLPEAVVLAVMSDLGTGKYTLVVMDLTIGSVSVGEDYDAADTHDILRYSGGVS